MTDKEKITEILKAYTKKHNIMASSVILEEYADELVKQGVVMPADDYCGYGERKGAEFDNLVKEMVGE